MTDKVIKVGIIYNAFDPINMVRAELDYNKKFKLKDYLVDLPTDCDWRIGLNGQPVELATHGEMCLSPEDNIILVVIPHGGSSGKSILRAVAMIAIVVGASALFGPGGALFGSTFAGLSGAATAALGIATITAAGSLLVNAVIPYKTPKSDSTTDSTSYGYDGAKNTIKQGVALPIVYGTFRVAGNYVDLYSENVGNDQYIYGRTVVSDGKIHAVRDPYIDDQPISNYTDINWGYTLGNDTEDVVSYFGRNINQVSKGIKLTGGASYTMHTTTAAVDQIQLNLEFTRGLLALDKKNNKENHTATVEVEISPHGAGTWVGLAAGIQMVDVKGDIGSNATPVTNKLSVTVLPTLSGSDFSYQIQYRVHGTSTWTTYQTIAGVSPSTSYDFGTEVLDWASVNSASAVYTNQSNEQTIEFDVPTAAYDIQVVGGTMTGYGYRVATGSPISTYSWSAQSTTTLRKTIESGIIDNGIYDIRIKKTSSEGDNETAVDELYLIDVGEITLPTVAHTNVATAWFRAKATDQLSGVPAITWITDGVECRQYDILGNVTTTAFTDNPAWIVLDMLISPERGSPGVYDIDFPMFVDWAQHCTDNGLAFNGIFDTTQSLWDAAVDVLKVGHASFSRIGTKLSLAIDKTSDPVMLFGPGNIYKDTFKIDYLPMSDRSNQFELSYFDKDDFNKQKTIRVVDEDAMNRGDLPRSAQYSLIGIDNFTQAQNEVWYQLYNNRYIRRTVTFDAPVESIGLNIGDIALIQHDMMNWGTSGRLNSGSTSTVLHLDKNVTMETAKSYKALVIHSSLIVEGAVVAWDGADKTYKIGGLSRTTHVLSDFNRFVTSTDDVRIISFTNIADHPTYGHSAIITLEEAPTFGSVFTGLKLVATDYIEERDVILDTSGPTPSITVTSAFAQAPAQYDNYMFGEAAIVKKPYRLKAISGTGFDRRTLTFTEFNDAIYAAPGHLVPQPATATPATVKHVIGLRYIYDFRSSSGNTNIPGSISWKTQAGADYGGADIYVSLNGADYVFNKTASGLQTSLDFHINDNVSIKVVAYGSNGQRAAVNTAPYISEQILAGPSVLAAPTEIDINQTSFIALGLVELDWDLPPDAEIDVTVPVALGNRANTTVNGRTITKTSGAAAWDASTTSGGVYSKSWCAATATGTTAAIFIGLNSGSLADSSFVMDYAWYLQGDGTCSVWRTGAQLGVIGTYSAGDYFMVVDDGVQVYYLKNELVAWITPSVAASRYLDTSFFNIGGSITDVAFGQLVDQQYKYRVQIQLDGSTTWDEYGVTDQKYLRVADLPAGNHAARVRTEKGPAYSGWLTETFTVATTDQTIQFGATRNHFAGEWNNVTNYLKGDEVTYLGDIYYCILDAAAGTALSNATYWQQEYDVSGIPGLNKYVWVAYADSSDGTVNFTNGAPGDRVFIGLAVNKPTATESTTPSDYTWSSYTGPQAFGLVATGSANIAGYKVQKIGTTAAFDSGVYSSEAWVNGASLGFRAAQTNAAFMVGLNTDPTTSVDFTDIDFAWYCEADASVAVYENGTAKYTSAGPYTTSTIFSIRYDGKKTYYYMDGVLKYTSTTAATGMKLYLDSSIYTTNGQFFINSFVPAGTTGNDAKTLVLVSDKQTITYDGTNTLSPSTQTTTFTANKQNSTATVTWTMTDLGGNILTASTYLSSTTGDSVTMTAANFSAAIAVNNTKGVIVIATMTDGVTISDQISIVKIQAGTDAVTAFLTNESATFAADTTGAVTDWTPANGTFKIYKGNVDITTGNGVLYSNPTTTGTGVSVTLNSSTGVYSITAMTSDSGTATIRAAYGGVNYDKILTLSKAKAGLPGAGFSLSCSALTFIYDSSGTASPSSQTILLTGILNGLTGTMTISGQRYTSTGSTLGAALTTSDFGGTGNNRSITNTTFGAAAYATITISLTVGSTTYTDTQTLIRVQQGSNAVSWVLSNEAINIPTDSSGGSGVYTPATGTFLLYDGATLKTGTGLVSFTVASSSGTTGQTIGTSSGVYSITGLTADVGTVVLDALYNSVHYQKTFTITKAKAGIAGSPGASTFTLINAGNMTITGNSAVKTGGTNGAYDASVQSAESFTGGATMSFSPAITAKEFLMGLSNSTNKASNSFDVTYSIVLRTGGTVEVYEAGTQKVGSPFTTWAVNDVFQVTYSGSAVKYAKNGTVFATTSAGTNLTLWLDSSFEVTGAQANNITFAKAGADGTGGAVYQPIGAIVGTSTATTGPVAGNAIAPVYIAGGSVVTLFFDGDPVYFAGTGSSVINGTFNYSVNNGSTWNPCSGSPTGAKASTLSSSGVASPDFAFSQTFTAPSTGYYLFQASFQRSTGILTYNVEGNMRVQ